MAVCLVLAVWVWVSSGEGLESLGSLLVGLAVGVPTVLWLLIVTVMVADRRPRIVLAARTTGRVLGAAAALIAVLTIRDPTPATPALVAMALAGFSLAALLGRPDVVASFGYHDVAARSGVVSATRRLRRGSVSVLAALAAVLALVWSGSMVAAFSGVGAETPASIPVWTGPPGTPIPPTALDRVGTTLPPAGEVRAAVLAEGFTPDDVHGRGIEVFAIPFDSAATQLGQVFVYANPRSTKYWEGLSGTRAGQYAFLTGSTCTYVAEPVAGLIVRAHRSEGCVPFANARWDFARRITARLAGG